MATCPDEGRIYEFGPFRLDPTEGRLVRKGQVVPLTPKAFDLLVYLVERHGRLVQKQALMAALWPNTVVEEVNLACNISALRKVLDEDEAASLIETVPTRGYRFVGEVTNDRNRSQDATSGPSIRPGASRARRGLLAASVLVAVALTAVAVWATRSSRARPPIPSARHVTAGDLRRLTFEPGLQTGPSWSPDGRSIAYASDKSGNYDIWNRNITDDTLVQLTSSPAHDTEPAWSPDGESIVFRSERDGGGLFIVSARGGPAQRLTSFGFRPKWAPDGSQILFAAAHYFQSERFLPKLFVVKPDGTPPREVLSAFIHRLNHMDDWNWYPNSRQVSVMGGNEGLGWGIFTIPVSGSTPQLLSEVEGTGDWRSFEWAPSGNTMFVKSVTRRLTTDVLKLSVDPTLTKILHIERVTANESTDVDLALSRDGERIAFTIPKPRMRLWSFPFDATTGRITGEGNPVTDPEATPLDFDLNRDGSRVVYALGRAGTERRELWATMLVNRKNEQLAADGQVRLSPIWSHDAGRVAYSWRRWRSGVYVEALVVRDMDSDDEQFMMTPRHGEGSVATGIPSDWSPDGRWILASSRDSSSASLGLWPVAAAPHADAGVKVLTSDHEHELWNGRFSPDGRWIVFTAVNQKGPRSIVFVIPRAGATRTQWVRLSSDHGWNQNPKWSPDGKLVYFSRSEGSPWNIWAVRFDSNRGLAIGDPFQITHFDSPHWQLSPDFVNTDLGVAANRLVVTMIEQVGGIWMLDKLDP